MWPQNQTLLPLLMPLLIRKLHSKVTSPGVETTVVLLFKLDKSKHIYIGGLVVWWSGGLVCFDKVGLFFFLGGGFIFEDEIYLKK